MIIHGGAMKKRLIFCLLIIIVFAVTVVFAILFIRKNTQLTMEGAINRRFSKKVINDYIEIDKMEYCPQALEIRKREVEQLRGNEKTYEEIFEEKNEKNKNLGIQYEVRNIELSTIYEVDDPQVFKDGWNINDIEEAHMVCVHYQIREKYDFNPEKFEKKYFSSIEYVEEENGVWTDWKDVVEWYEAYKVDGKWYCIYADE